jgi:hypothetical protein
VLGPPVVLDERVVVEVAEESLGALEPAGGGLRLEVLTVDLPVVPEARVDQVLDLLLLRRESRVAGHHDRVVLRALSALLGDHVAGGAQEDPSLS